MAERTYTVREIDALRDACEMRYEFGTTYLPNGGVGRSHRESDMVVAVEEMIRTYMTAGLTAADIYESDKQAVSTSGKQREGKGE